MPRVARVVVADVAYHVTQRGNARQHLLASDTERMVYLDLLRRGLAKHRLSVLGYCLMSNHVHLVAIPREAQTLSEVFHQVHGKYAAYWNAAHSRSGHAWQERFYSCPMDTGHLWMALRYAELNPVRARMVTEATEWPWSSAAAHCGTAPPDVCLDMTTWREYWSEASWRSYLDETERESELRVIRRCTYKGLPLGPPEFTRTLEERTSRCLTPARRGRPRKVPIPNPDTVIAA